MNEDQFSYEFAKDIVKSPIIIKDKDGKILQEPTEFMNRPENLKKVETLWKHSMELEILYGYSYEKLLKLSPDQIEALWAKEDHDFKERTTQ